MTVESLLNRVLWTEPPLSAFVALNFRKNDLSIILCATFYVSVAQFDFKWNKCTGHFGPKNFTGLAGGQWTCEGQNVAQNAPRALSLMPPNWSRTPEIIHQTAPERFRGPWLILGPQEDSEARLAFPRYWISCSIRNLPCGTLHFHLTYSQLATPHWL